MKRHFITTLVIILAVIICAVFLYLTISIKRKNAELKARQERLEELLAEQEARTLELEDTEIYAQTKKYIEEKAKSIGYVYPDEIIFKKDE